ncbi:hypothetical protein EVAR_33752_1 [Eumeta japonica]|uniref:Transcription factor TFIIIC triple barrel domain-containing protein n=1 Tax=Eumeta variegata TaxID=151549 RepID=A0A4C1VSU9_EUMVA|nr:hypothetical protein EVAR_33752_1 [Eumeta japonica]
MSVYDSGSEEELIVYAEMDDNIDIEKYRSVHVLGVDTRNPMMQMDDTFFMAVFGHFTQPHHPAIALLRPPNAAHAAALYRSKFFCKGKYEPSLGTYMFFEEDPDAQSSDPLFDKLPEKCLKYLCKSRKVIKFEQTYVVPKEGMDQELQNCLQEKEENIEIANFPSMQVAIEKFKTEWDPDNVQNSYFDCEQSAESSDTLEDTKQTVQECLANSVRAMLCENGLARTVKYGRKVITSVVGFSFSQLELLSEIEMSKGEQERWGDSELRYGSADITLSVVSGGADERLQTMERQRKPLFL